MLLAVDVGNTNTVFAIYEGTKILAEWRCSTNQERTADEYFIWLRELIAFQKIDVLAINAMVISAVVPKVVFNLRVMANRYFNCRPLVVGKRDCKIPITLRVDKGVKVGADRIVNSIGAFQKFGGNLVIVDFGTATTFDVIDTDGAYAGGIIAPGVNLSLKALCEAAAALPFIDVSKPKAIIGTNTVDCMQSGIFWGYVSLIEGLIMRIKNEKSNNLKTIATGGLAPLFSKETNIFEEVDLNLTLNGLMNIYEYNLRVQNK